MKSKKLGLIAASVLMLGLVACGANDANQSTGNNQNNQVGTSGTGSQMGILGNNGRVDNRNFGQDRDGIDNNGPLTEDYEKEPGDLNFTGTRRNGNTIQSNNRGNGIDNYRADGENDVNLYGGNSNSKKNNKNNDMNISSYKTGKSSENYPHTRAILVREARYQYVPIGRGEHQHAQGGDERGQRNDTQQQPAAPNHDQQAPTNQPEPAQPAQPIQEQQNQPEPAQPKKEQQQQPQQQAPEGISQAAQQVIDLTNEQRKQNGLPALQADTQLSGVAQMKSEDMRQNGYFSHTSPTHGSPFDMMRDQGVSYKTAGENIAQGQPTPQEVVKAWMDSPGHRKNILSPDFTHIGVGYDSSGHHWTQMFIGK
ncbi:MAG: CAP domain-containing protein [Bacillota bacterium]